MKLARAAKWCVQIRNESTLVSSAPNLLALHIKKYYPLSGGAPDMTGFTAALKSLLGGKHKAKVPILRSSAYVESISKQLYASVCDSHISSN
jgi:hypothetical protein